MKITRNTNPLLFSLGSSLPFKTPKEELAKNSKENVLQAKDRQLLRQLQSSHEEDTGKKNPHTVDEEEILLREKNTRHLVGVKETSKKMMEELLKKKQLEEQEKKKLRASHIYRKIARGEQATAEEEYLLKKYFPKALAKAKNTLAERKNIQQKIQNSATKKEAQKILDLSEKEIFEVDKDKPVSLRQKLQIDIAFKREE